MNKELLDKLKFQAAAQVSPLLEGSEWQQVYSEKFAELIVRECGNYMNSRIPGNIEVSATVTKMKKHFGVEK